MSSPFQKGSPPSSAAAKSEERAADKALAIKQNAQSALDKKASESIGTISTFDWKQIPPPVMAQLLMKTPFRGSAGEPDYYLAEWQAYRFAIRAYELGLSPLSGEVWYNAKNNMTNVTLEGKLKLARLNGLNLGPPHFERVTKNASSARTGAITPSQDWGYKCTMTTGREGEKAEYTAWYSEWNVPKSPVWREKPEHMLMVRATEKCLSFASGIGVSELPGENDLGREPEKTELPTIEATNFTYKEQETKQ